MNVKIKFKELVITGAPSIDVACQEIEKRNPDVKIDEAREK